MAKRLYKSRERVLSGVCGGIAEYINMDPTIIRLLMVVALIVSFGFAVAAYVIASFIIPEYPQSFEDTQLTKDENADRLHSDDEFDKYFKK